jgi:hypothetical protein
MVGRDKPIRSLADALGKVAENVDDEINMLDLAALGRAVGNLTGTRALKSETGDKNLIKTEVKQQSTVKREETDDDVSAVPANLKIDPDSKDGVLRARQPNAATLNLSDLSAEELSRQVTAVEESLAYIARAHELLKGDPSSAAPALSQPFSAASSIVGRKRKQGDIQGQGSDDEDDEEMRTNEAKRRTRSAGRFFHAGSGDTSSSSRSFTRAPSIPSSEIVSPASTSTLMDMPTNVEDDDETGDFGPAKRNQASSPDGNGKPRLQRSSLVQIQTKNGQKRAEPILNRRQDGAKGKGKNNAADDDDGDGDDDDDNDDESEIEEVMPSVGSRTDLRNVISRFLRAREVP